MEVRISAFAGVEAKQIEDSKLQKKYLSITHKEQPLCFVTV